MTETLYVFLKRDLFECPGHHGYTGIKEFAGSWPLSLVKSETVPVKDQYDPKFLDSYALPVDLAPDFTKACFHDIAIAHLQKKAADAFALLSRAGEYVTDAIPELEEKAKRYAAYPTLARRADADLADARQLQSEITEALKGAKA